MPADRSFRIQEINFVEYVFRVHVKVGIQNVIIWGTELPQDETETATDSEEVTLWCAASVQ